MAEIVTFTPRNRYEAIKDFWLGLAGFNYSFKDAMKRSPLRIANDRIKVAYHSSSKNTYYVQFASADGALFTLRLKSCPSELIASKTPFMFKAKLYGTIVALMFFWVGIIFAPATIIIRILKLFLRPAAQDFMAAVYANTVCDVHCTRDFMDLSYDILFRFSEFSLLCAGVCLAYLYIQKNRFRSGIVFRCIKVMSCLYVAVFLKVNFFPTDRPSILKEISLYKTMKEKSSYSILSAVKMNLNDTSRLSSDDL